MTSSHPGHEVASQVVLDPSLEELAAIINGTHRDVVIAARTTLERAICAGDAILQARRLVPAGEWMEWVKENLDISRHQAARYARVALHRQVIERHSAETISGAERVLDRMELHLGHAPGLPQLGNGHVGWAPEIVAEVKRLRGQGLAYKPISEALGGSPSPAAVARIVDPERHREILQRSRAKSRARDAERAARKKAAAEAAKANQLKARVGARGKELAEAYSLIRRAAQCLDRVRSDDPDFREAVASALASLYRAEDKIGRAA